MKVHKSCLIVLAAAICVLGFHGSATAIQVKNLTTDTVVFYDDFEDVTPVSHNAYPDASGDFDPVATVGTWALITELQSDVATEKPENVQVTDYSTPGAVQGDNYLRMAIAAAGEWSYVETDFSAAQSTPDDQVHMEFMAMLTVSTKTLFYVRGSGDVARLHLYANSNQLRNFWGNKSTEYDVVDVNYTPNVWQKWEFDYTIGATTWTLSIDDVSSSPLRTKGDLGGDLADMYVRQSSAHASYLDSSVPETPRLPGDADKNGTVDALDAAILADNWLASDAIWAMGDFNNDGLVNDIDATMMAVNWLKSMGGDAAAAPEPSAAVMLLCAAVAMFILRRRIYNND